MPKPRCPKCRDKEEKRKTETDEPGPGRRHPGRHPGYRPPAPDHHRLSPANICSPPHPVLTSTATFLKGKVVEVFISWSGDRSEKVADALRGWLPSVIQSVEPFMSASDIEKGTRWANDIGEHLEKAQFGLICLTEENLEAPWLLFEAGALSKSIEDSRVVPYLYGVSKTELKGPLAQFQGAVADKNSTFDVLKSINQECGDNGLDQARLESAFEIWWPKLEEMLHSIPAATQETPPSRSERDILEEVLDLCRQMSRRRASRPELDLQEFRNRFVHGLNREPAVLTESLNIDNLSIPIDTAQRDEARRVLYQYLTSYEIELARLRREASRDAQPSSESEEQSSNDAANGAET